MTSYFYFILIFATRLLVIIDNIYYRQLALSHTLFRVYYCVFWQNISFLKKNDGPIDV